MEAMMNNLSIESYIENVCNHFGYNAITPIWPDGKVDMQSILNLSKLKLLGDREIDPYDLVRVLKSSQNPVIIHKNITSKQCADWCYLAKRYNKQINFFGVSPEVVSKQVENLLDLSSQGLIGFIYVPVLSNDLDNLAKNGIKWVYTMSLFSIIELLHNSGIKTATTLIKSWVNSDSQFEYNNRWMQKQFDYIDYIE